VAQAVLGGFPVDALIHELPKTDLHRHAEASARLDRVLARRQGRAGYDWARRRAEVLSATPPGLVRLDRLAEGLALPTETLERDPENMVARIADALEEAAADRAVLVEIRFGRATVLYPEFMGIFRVAEERVRQRHPWLHAEALITLYPHEDSEELLGACLAAAREGLAGIDLIPLPYENEASDGPLREWASRAADGGLGVTVHAGEFSSANLASALGVHGVTRIGHALHAASDPRLLDRVAQSGVTIECCLTSNVVLGAVGSYEEHPIRRFVDSGIRVTLSSDNPVRLGTTIAHEYAVAATLGFSPAELLHFTRCGIEASFTSADRRAALLSDLIDRER
jgi:adenosine deaminase